MKKILAISIVLVGVVFFSNAQPSIKIAKLKYNGGGDWYANKTALPNVIDFCNRSLQMNLAKEEDVVDVGSADLYLYPYIYMTGHGNVVFSNQEAENLRNYLMAGGFLHIDDNYGLDQFVRLEMKKVFPNLEFVELPFDHPIYHQRFQFKEGLPKIHEHDGKPPQGFGLIYEGRLVCFYSYECDLGNGWEDQIIYNDPEAIRQEALKMGANIISFAFTQMDTSRKEVKIGDRLPDEFQFAPSQAVEQQNKQRHSFAALDSGQWQGSPPDEAGNLKFVPIVRYPNEQRPL
jgi:hypothetical protein